MSKGRTSRDPVARAAVSVDDGSQSLGSLKAAIRERVGSDNADFLVDLLTGMPFVPLLYKYAVGQTGGWELLVPRYEQLLVAIGHMRHGDLLGDMPELGMDELEWLLRRLQEYNAGRRQDVGTGCGYHPDHVQELGLVTWQCLACPCHIADPGDISRRGKAGRPREYCSNACRQRGYRRRSYRAKHPDAPLPPEPKGRWVVGRVSVHGT